MNPVKALVAIGLLGLAGCATPPPAGGGHGHAKPAAAAKPAAPTPEERAQMWKKSLARDPLSMTAAFDATGRLWLAAVKSGHVVVNYSSDKGRSFGAPVQVNAEPENIAADGENRPKLAFGPKGEIYVSWTQSLDTPFSGHVRFARSLDGGKSFSAPIVVNTDRQAISHRFDSLLVNGRGDIYLFWLDKRDAAASEGKGGKYSGLAVYYAVSTDGGASFGANRKAADHSCECCRIAAAADTDDVPVILWRQIFGKNTRDHALLRLDGKSTLVRASEDGWELDACPHHGPALSIGANGVYHLAWYTGAEGRAGLYYRRSLDRGKTFTAPLAFGDPGAQPARPQVLSLGPRVFLTWKEFDGASSAVRLMRSMDGGATWSAPALVATAAGASDHPLLVRDGAKAYLSWYAAKEGYRLVELEGAR